MNTFQVRVYTLSPLQYMVPIYLLASVISRFLFPKNDFVPSLVILLVPFALVAFYTWKGRRHQLSITESHLVIGRVTLYPKQIHRMKIQRDKSKIRVVIPDGYARSAPIFKSITVRPLNNDDIFYEDILQWAKGHRITIVE